MTSWKFHLLLLPLLLLLPFTCAKSSEIQTPQPCKAVAENDVLGLIDVVELALCGNPQTREVWANTRFQEAQLAVSQATYLPTINGSLSVARSMSDMSGTFSPVDTCDWRERTGHPAAISIGSHHHFSGGLLYRRGGRYWRCIAGDDDERYGSYHLVAVRADRFCSGRSNGRVLRLLSGQEGGTTQSYRGVALSIKTSILNK